MLHNKTSLDYSFVEEIHRFRVNLGIKLSGFSTGIVLRYPISWPGTIWSSLKMLEATLQEYKFFNQNGT